VFRLSLSVGALLDLREPATWDALSLAGAPDCFAKIAVCRVVSGFVRETTEAQALLAPSVAFLDDLGWWCLVLFLDKLPPLDQVVTTVRPEGLLSRS